MDLKVRNIDFNYDNDNIVTSVNVRFDSHNTNNNEPVVLNGYIRISKEEYDTNATDLNALAVLAKNKIKEKINA